MCDWKHSGREKTAGRTAQLREGEPKAAERQRAQPALGGTETLGHFAACVTPGFGWKLTVTASGSMNRDSREVRLKNIT